MSTLPATTLRALVEKTQLEGLSKSTSFRVDPTLLVLSEGFNLRIEGVELDAHIERLYQAMKAGAFVPPIDTMVEDGQIVVKDGHCRTRAALRLKKEMPEFTLDCRQLRGNEQDAVLHMLGTGTGGKALSPLEQGRGYLRLIRFGLTSAQIAKKLGVSRVTVDNGLTLAEAPADVQKLIEEGSVSATVARDAIAQGKEGVKALKDAAKGAKKKVTAKTLKGTKAEKGAKGKAEEPEPQVEDIDGDDFKLSSSPPPDNGLVAISVKRPVAKAGLHFLRQFLKTVDNPMLAELADTFEAAML